MIAFLHTILTHAKTSEFIRRVLVVVPKNVVINWKKEFEKWLTDELDVINVSDISSFESYVLTIVGDGNRYNQGLQG